VLFDFMEMRGGCPATGRFFVVLANNRSTSEVLKESERVRSQACSVGRHGLPIDWQLPNLVSAAIFHILRKPHPSNDLPNMETFIPKNIATRYVILYNG
jgi:hypothetical protein